MGFAWPAHHCTAGALLPHHFALTGIFHFSFLISHLPFLISHFDEELDQKCEMKDERCEMKDSGGIFSVALSVGSPRLAVSQHPALWSPDFPHFSARPLSRLELLHSIGLPIRN